MKLRNKKTGAIYKIEDIDLGNNEYGIWVGLTKYNSLAEFNEEWEDYEEPREYWFIDYEGGIIPFSRQKETATDKLMKSIGNYFKTEEEAKKAVEKLKAWKRLKDNGFRFDGKTLDTAKRFGSIFYWLDENAYSEEYIKDLELLFGDEQ